MGLAATLKNCNIYCLPGPPREMTPMFENHVAPKLPVVDDDNAYMTEYVHAFGIGESDAAQRLGRLLDRNRQPQLGITVSDATLTIRIRARGPRDRITKQIAADATAVEKVLSPFVFGRGNDSLSRSVGQLLQQRGALVATAESCTGGLLGKVLVDEPGSSSYYYGGWVTYSDELKSKCINVPASLIESHGAVSTEVAQAMAEGALAEADCDYALSITGVAGPDGGTATKPIGTVFVGIAARIQSTAKTNCRVRRFQFTGDRMMIRDRSAKSALQMLRFELLSLDAPPLLWEFRAGEEQQSAAVTPLETSRGGG